MRRGSFQTHDRRGRKKRTAVFLSRLCVFIILLLVAGTIFYDADLSDANDPPVMVSQLPDILYAEANEITPADIIHYTISLPLIYKEFSLNRAPPA